MLRAKGRPVSCHRNKPDFPNEVQTTVIRVGESDVYIWGCGLKNVHGTEFLYSVTEYFKGKVTEKGYKWKTKNLVPPTKRHFTS